MRARAFVGRRCYGVLGMYPLGVQNRQTSMSWQIESGEEPFLRKD